MKKAIILFLVLCSSFIMYSCGKTPKSILVYNEKTEFEFGENFSVGNNMVVAIRYDDNTTDQITTGNLVRNSLTTYTNGEITIDFSAYDKTTLGTYEILIIYGENNEINLSYYVTVTESTKSVNYDVIGYTGNYDGKYKSLSFNLPEDDTISTVFSYDGKTYDIIECPSYKNVGNYKVYYKISRYGFPDYYGDDDIIIKKIDLHVKPSDGETTYGLDYNLSTQTCTFRGFVNNENESIFDGEIVYTTNYHTGSNAGDYKIYASGLEAGNYNIIYDEGRLHVNKAQNTLIITFNNITYGSKFVPEIKTNYGNGRLTYKYSESGKDEFVNAIPVNVGTYDIKCTCAESTNYTQSEIVVKDVSILPAKLFITPVTNAISYSDDFDFATIHNEFEGFVNNDSASSLEISSEGLKYSTDYKKNFPAGEYNIYLSGYLSNNYDIVNKTGILVVNKIYNDLRIDFSSKTYDSKVLEPIITKQPCDEDINYYYILGGVTYTGLPTNAGLYTIIVDQPESANYTQYYNEFYDILIQKILLEIEWDQTSFFYDGTPKCPKAICKNILPGEDVEALTKTENECINASISFYTAYCYDVTSINYKLPSSRTVNFYIYKQIVYTPQIDNVVYDGQNHNSGLTNNEVYTVKDVGNGITAGDHTVVLELNHPDNYVWNDSSDVTLTFKYKILKADNEITYFNVPSWEYNESPSEFEITLRYTDTTKNIVKRYKLRDAENFSSVVPTAVGDYSAQITITSNNYNTITETADFSIIKVDAKYKVVDCINANLGSTYGDVIFPLDTIGKWQLTDNAEDVFTTEGITKINVIFIPFEEHIDGYNSVNTTICVNVVQDLDTLTEFNKSNVTISDQTIKVGKPMQINYRVTNYNNINVYFSLSQDSGYDTTLDLEATSENVGTYTVWVKFELPLYTPYFTHITLTIEE